MTAISRLPLTPALMAFLKLCCFLEGVLAVLLCCFSVAPLSKLSHLFQGLDLIYIEVLKAQFTIGVTVAVFTYTGVLVSTHVIEHHYVTSIKGTHIIWNSLAVVLIGYVVEVSTAASKVESLAHEELHRSLMRGIHQYLGDAMWHARFNAIHQELRCCGVDDFEDWLEKAWIPLEMLKYSFIEKGRIHPNGRLEDPVLPASCCNPDSPGPCFHDFLQQGPKVTMETIVDSVFTNGCVAAAEIHFNFAIQAFHIISIIICVFQVLQIVIANILYIWRERE